MGGRRCSFFQIFICVYVYKKWSLKFSNFVSQLLFVIKLLYLIKSKKSNIGADPLSKYHRHWSTTSLIQLTSYLFVAGSCHAHVIGASCQSLCTLGRGWRGRWSEMTICKYFSWGLIINEVHRPLVMFRSNYKVRGCFHDVHAWCLYIPILKPCRVMATAPGSSALELMAGNFNDSPRQCKHWQPLTFCSVCRIGGILLFSVQK